MYISNTTPSQHDSIITVLSDCNSLPGGGELLPWSESGDGSGVGSSDGSGIVIDPPDCMATSLNITVTVFESIAKSLSQLGCTVEEGKLIVYISSSPKLRLSEFQNSIVFGDYFAYSDDLQTFSLEVCTYDALMDDDACSDETVEVSANINRHSGRLLPFGASFSDSSVTNADDRSVGVFLSRPIPFWNSYYTSVYVSHTIQLRVLFALTFILWKCK